MTTGPWKPHIFRRYGIWWKIDERGRVHMWLRDSKEFATYLAPYGSVKVVLDVVRTVGRNRQRQLAELIR